MIAGVTDRRIPRRDGKIRSGHKGNDGRPINDPFFLLHDAQQLVGVLGEHPKEIYCTFFGDDPEEVAPADLRQYTQSELVCRSTHKAPSGVETPMTNIAAFYALGSCEGVTAKPHPWMPKSRERICKYKNCPDYEVNEVCSEHMFINMVIPQYSMGSMFTLETTSIFALLDVYGAMQKVADMNIAKGGKISGEIFRVFKYERPMPFLNTKTGQKGKSNKWCVGMQHVPYDAYLKLFGDKLRADDLEALDALRKRPVYGIGFDAIRIGGAIEDAAQLTSGAAQAQLEAPLAQKSEDDYVKARANHADVLPLFEEYGRLLGRDATEAARLNTAKNFADAATLAKYLKGKIAEVKKKQETAASAAQQVAVTTTTPPQAAAKPGQPIDVNLLGD